MDVFSLQKGNSPHYFIGINSSGYYINPALLAPLAK
jgi:hypothetical protein